MATSPTVENLPSTLPILLSAFAFPIVNFSMMPASLARFSALMASPVDSMTLRFPFASTVILSPALNGMSLVTAPRLTDWYADKADCFVAYCSLENPFTYPIPAKAAKASGMNPYKSTSNTSLTVMNPISTHVIPLSTACKKLGNHPTTN